MKTDDLERWLHAYISNEILEGRTIELSSTTPLLEWGIVNSIEVTGLLASVKAQLGVDIEPKKVSAKSLRSIEAIAQMIFDAQSTSVRSQP